MAGRREQGLHFCGLEGERPKNQWPARLFKYPMRMYKVRRTNPKQAGEIPVIRQGRGKAAQ